MCMAGFVVLALLAASLEIPRILQLLASRIDAERGNRDRNLEHALSTILGHPAGVSWLKKLLATFYDSKIEIDTYFLCKGIENQMDTTLKRSISPQTQPDFVFSSMQVLIIDFFSRRVKNWSLSLLGHRNSHLFQFFKRLFSHLSI